LQQTSNDGYAVEDPTSGFAQLQIISSGLMYINVTETSPVPYNVTNALLMHAYILKVRACVVGGVFLSACEMIAALPGWKSELCHVVDSTNGHRVECIE
jgi:hypothetical protein